MKRIIDIVTAIFVVNLYLFVTGLEIKFLSIHSTTSLPYSLDYVGSAIDFAMVEVKAKYPNYTFSLVTFDAKSAEDMTCPDIEKDALVFAAESLFVGGFKENETLTAILAPGMIKH